MKKPLSLLLALILLLSVCSLAAAEGAWKPESPITMIVPYNTGGTTDTVGRIVAQYMSAELGVQINVVNQAGASGELGTLALADAKPDGYTCAMLGIADNIVIDGTKDSVKLTDVDLLGQFISTCFSIYAKPGSAFTSLDDVIAFAKENPGMVTIAESGSAVRLFALMFADQSGIEVTTVSFSSGGDSTSALLGGHVELAALTPSYAANVLEGGGSIIGFAGTYRWPGYEDVLYFDDLGYQLNAVGSTPTLALPVGCPDEVRQAYIDAMMNLSENETFKQTLADGGYPWAFACGEEFDQTFSENSAIALAALQENIDLFK